MLTLSLLELRKVSALSSVFGENLAHAASVCLDEQRHERPVSLEINGDIQVETVLYWDPPTPEIRRTWNDDEVTTEYGAYGIAILLIPKTTEFKVVERAKKGRGFDYWLGSKEEQGPLFQRKGRLEVSGVRTGDISGRVSQKIAQVKAHYSTLPAVVIVVGFSKPESRVIKWNV